MEPRIGNVQVVTAFVPLSEGSKLAGGGLYQSTVDVNTGVDEEVA